MKINGFITTTIGSLSTFLILSVTAFAESEDSGALRLRDLEVTAGLRSNPAIEVPSSSTIFDSVALEESDARHFEDLIGLTPNLNYSGGTARPRFFQMRGIGELDQYDEPVIPSVGFIVDDIDFSGIGSAASLFDARQVEVLRGPQGSIFGANAMAGLVNVRSNEPTDYFTGHTLMDYGTYNSYQLGLALGGPLMQSDPSVLTYRLSLHHLYSDGFMENTTLGRKDTDKLEEFTGRLRLRYRPSEHLTIDFTGLYLNFNNGYDAFSFEDGFKTQTNDPGKDTQETFGGSLRANWSGAERFEILSITAAADTDSVYRFDADWGMEDDFEQYDRRRKFVSQELRVSSKPAGRIFNDRTDWTTGVYTKRKDESATENQSYGDFFLESDNDYVTDIFALYGQLEHDLRRGFRLIIGARGEHRDVEYSDSYGSRFTPSDNMYGGNISLQYAIDDNSVGYATIARGYRGSGFNPNPMTPEDIRVYSSEHLWNYEIGLRNDFERASTDLSIFYTRRSDPQIKWWDPGPPWVPYTVNGEKGYNYGADASLTYSPIDTLKLFASLGLLETKIYSERIEVLEDGRGQSHAPGYQYSAGADLRLRSGYAARVELVGSDSFYFDNYFNAESDAYEIVNARVGYESQQWSFYLWGRNIFDKTYAVRGLDLGDIYTQKGAPAQFGATLRYFF